MKSRLFPWLNRLRSHYKQRMVLGSPWRLSLQAKSRENLKYASARQSSWEKAHQRVKKVRICQHNSAHRVTGSGKAVHCHIYLEFDPQSFSPSCGFGMRSCYCSVDTHVRGGGIIPLPPAETLGPCNQQVYRPGERDGNSKILRALTILGEMVVLRLHCKHVDRCRPRGAASNNHRKTSVEDIQQSNHNLCVFVSLIVSGLDTSMNAR